MHHYFLDKQTLSSVDTANFLLDLRPEDLRHARAQRLKPGEHISVVDSDGVYFELEVIDFNKSGVLVRIASRISAKPSDFKITLIQGISKQDKMATVLRSATEICIDKYIPCEFRRSIIRLKDFDKKTRMDRLFEVARSAAMQSGRLSIPEIAKPISLTDEVSNLGEYDKVIVFYEACDLNSFFEDAITSKDKNIGIIIGPEGGFDMSEIDTLSTLNNVYICSLGTSILRTETAGIVAPALVANHLRRSS